MRKGLLSWSEDEVPKSVLEGRVRRAQAAMSAAGLDALLIYTNFPRPAGVSFLTHFVPYWSQGALLVPPAGMPNLYVNLSKRVAGWMKETAHVEAVVSTPRLGQTLGEALSRTKSGAVKLGVVELSKFPGSVLSSLAETHGNVAYADATGLFASIRHPADDVELMLSRRATEIARDAVIAAVAEAPERTGELAAVVEYAGRTGGAEEIIIDVCADLARSVQLQRFEGDEALGKRYAVRASVAYKGHWVRWGRTVAGGNAGLADATAAITAAIDAGGHRQQSEGATIVTETCIGCSPLSVVTTAPEGAVTSVTVSGTGPNGAWCISEPIITARRGTAAERLID